VCNGVADCPQTETSNGGEDEEICPENEGCGDGPEAFSLDNVDRETWCFDTLVIKCTCRIGWAGNGEYCGVDSDLDGYPDQDLPCSDRLTTTRFKVTAGDDAEKCRADNCPSKPNSGQEDADNDGIGNTCDNDNDNDGIVNDNDNCLNIHNPDQSNRDNDKYGDACDLCPDVADDEHDTDGDGKADACDEDIDGDGRTNAMNCVPSRCSGNDNCPYHPNSDQKDSDGDGLGDVCDNCPANSNSDQADGNENGIGDVCDGGQDGDKDGIPDSLDNCANEPNNDQNDQDGDGRGDVCDNDKDGDGVTDDTDNCPLVHNPGQEDTNNNKVGDHCDGDWDGDGTTDFLDNCPNNSRVSITNFNNFQTIALDPHGSSQRDPEWVILNEGAEITQTLNSDPGLAIGQDKLGGVDFEGTFFVNTRRDDDYVGFVFSYQSNSKFYVVMWKKSRQTYWERQPFRAIAKPGIQLKLVDSIHGPGTWLRNAMWHTGHTRDHVKLLWEDPEQQGWESEVAYRWLLIHRPKIGLIRLRIFKGQEVVADSGNVIENTLKGGRLGVFCFSQEDLIWSDLSYNCRQKLPEEVYNELSPEEQNEVEVDEQLPWRVVGNAARWSGSPKRSATRSAKQGTSRARTSLENSHLYNTETQKCFA